MKMKSSRGKIINFGKDFHPEFEGWIGEDGDGVWISFIESKEKGKGNFSKLLDELKEKYTWIKVPTPFALMREICLRKGFVAKKEYFPAPFNEVGEVLKWRKKVGG